MRDFIMNAWYMAGWGHELIAGEMLSRRLLDLPLVLFRDEDGSAAALIDRCPHRFAPLSRGSMVGSQVQCGYHGLRFNGDGRCVHNPQSEEIASTLSVRSFPVVERDNILWFWPGDANMAEEARIPSFPAHLDEAFDFVWGYSSVDANYELIADNLLDFSHVTYLHPAFGGNSYKPDFSMTLQENGVIAQYFTKAMPNSMFGEMSFHAGGSEVDELDVVTWTVPSIVSLNVYRNFTGQDPKSGGHNPSAHILTPETTRSTHYFWGSGMPRALNADRELHRAILTQAFENEDKPMIAAVQQAMDNHDFWAMKPAILTGDKAAVVARRKLRQSIRAEDASERGIEHLPEIEELIQAVPE